MIRKIIHINEEKCDGCGLCAQACHEGAIAMIEGKARLIRDDYCDGLGDCLPACPRNAISFIEREAAPYDEAAVKAHLASEGKATGSVAPNSDSIGKSGGCPGAMARQLSPSAGCPGSQMKNLSREKKSLQEEESFHGRSALSNWPVQIRLAPARAPYFEGADLLIAADCGAFAYGAFHRDFIQGRVTLIGCPKLDPVQYEEKLAEIFASNDVRSITLTRMQVPCCGGLEHSIRRALAVCGKEIPLHVTVIALDGSIVK